MREHTEISIEMMEIFLIILVGLLRGKAHFVDNGAVGGDVEGAVSPHSVAQLVR